MCNRLFFSVGKRKMSPLASKPRSELRRLSVKLQNWTLPRQANNLNVLPSYAVAQPGSYGLHSGFLGGKAGRQTLSGVGFAHAIPDFGGGEDTVQKSVTKALYGTLNPAHFGDVNSCPYNHLGLCAKVSYRWLCASKPKLIY
jgi:hypothetical protein